MLDFAGVEIPEEMQGKSLKQVLTNQGAEPADWRQSTYYHYVEFPSEHAVKKHYGVRTKKYKLIHFYEDIDQWEMYDLSKDPKEMKSVYGDPDYASIQAELHQELKRLQKEYGDERPINLDVEKKLTNTPYSVNQEIYLQVRIW